MLKFIRRNALSICMCTGLKQNILLEPVRVGEGYSFALKSINIPLK